MMMMIWWFKKSSMIILFLKTNSLYSSMVINISANVMFVDDLLLCLFVCKKRPSRISRGSSTVFSPQFPDVQLFYLLAVTIQSLGGSLLTFWCLLELWVYIVPFKWGANELLRVSTTWSIIRIWSFPAFPSLKKPDKLLDFFILHHWGYGDGMG